MYYIAAQNRRVFSSTLVTKGAKGLVCMWLSLSADSASTRCSWPVHDVFFHVCSSTAKSKTTIFWELGAKASGAAGGCLCTFECLMADTGLMEGFVHKCA